MLLEQYTGEYFHELGVGWDFLRQWNHKLDFIIIKNFCSSKDTVKKTNR